MADDGDSFVTIGTAFDIPDEDAPKKKALPIHEQFATDKEGRRRFHGAFTGGFSAGYFNTVGSKEGWTPSTFVSSRSKRIESLHQKPEDFMDEDDLDEFGIAPRNVETTKLFSQEKASAQKRRDVGPSNESPGDANMNLGTMVRFALEEMVVPCRMSIGVKLLKKMGWKEGQGIGQRVQRLSKTKVYGCALPSNQVANKEEQESDIYAEGLLFAPKDTKPITFIPKDNTHGIGYTGISTSSLSSNIPKPGYSGNLEIKGQAFGVGAFEDDDGDVYADDSMANYDLELNDRKPTESHLHGWTGPPSYTEKGGQLSNFVRASKPRAANKVFPPPVIPKGYQPFLSQRKTTEVKPSQTETEKHGARHLTSDDRAELLGEKPSPKPVKSVFDYINKLDKDRITSAKKENEKQKKFAGPGIFQPFAKDPKKQTRYEHFLECRKNGKQIDIPKELCAGLTEWEREREKEEFTRSAMIFQPLKGNMASRFIAGGNIDDERNDIYEERTGTKVTSVEDNAAENQMFGKLTRNTFDWHPAKLLCKRFNVPEPYPSSKTVGLAVQVHSEKFSMAELFKSSVQHVDDPQQSVTSNTDQTEQSPTPLPALAQPMADITNTNTDTKDEDTEAVPTSKTSDSTNNFNEDESKEKPSMDLFKSIFASSSEESEMSQSEDEVVEVDENPSKPSTSVVPDSNINSMSGNIVCHTDDSIVKDALPVDNNLNAPNKQITEEPEDQLYGPTPPPRISTKGDKVALSSSFKTPKTVPFSDSILGDKGETKRSKKSKKHKTKHKHKHKERNRENVTSEREKVVEKKVDKKHKSELPSDKEILSKLKTVQKKRMCAADFM